MATVQHDTFLHSNHLGPAYGVAIIVLGLLTARAVRSRRFLSDVPCPTGSSWLWGHEKAIFTNSAGALYTAWLRELGSIIRVKGALMKPDILVVGDPAALTYIQQRQPYDFPHSESTRSRIDRMLGRSLGWVEGQSEHRRMRNLLAPALTQENVRAGASDVLDAVSNIQILLSEKLQQSDGSQVINIAYWTSAVTMDVIGRFAFAHDFDGGRSEDSQVILNSWRKMATMAASPNAFTAIMLSRCFSFISSLPLPAFKAQSNVRTTIYNGVAKELVRRNDIAEKGQSGRDLLTILLEARRNEQISQQELLDHIVFFILAGSESSSQVLAACLWELSRQTSIQDRLRQEVKDLRDLDYGGDVSKLPLLDAVCKEALRLYPPIPSVERVAAKDDVLPLTHPIRTTSGRLLTELLIEKGQILQIPMISINRLVWEDGDTFRPDRWFGTLPPSNLLPTGWSHTLAFGDGPRNCLGYRLAVFEFKALLATLIRHFKFETTGIELDFRVATSMQAFVKGRTHEGPQIPLKVSIVDEASS